MVITEIRLVALATAYVSGVTWFKIVKATKFCNQLRPPSNKRRIIVSPGSLLNNCMEDQLHFINKGIA